MTRLGFSEAGKADGRAMVFLHGAGMSGWMWRLQLERFSALGYRCVALDLPDHGKSRGLPFASIEDCADEVAGIADRLSSGSSGLGGQGAEGLKPVIVGHSLGAKVALELIARHPEAVGGAVISSALVRPSALIAAMDSHVLNALSLRMLRNERIAKAQAKAFDFPDGSYVDAYLGEIAALEIGNLDRPIGAFARRLFLPEGLGKATCPVLVTAGGGEGKAMLCSARDIAAALPRAELRILEGAKHNYPWARAGAYDALIEDWLAGSGLGD